MPDILDAALIDNTSQRLPCVLLLDGSASMSGTPIQELNAGLKILEDELKKDNVASQRVQLLVIRFGGNDEVEVLVDWTDAMSFAPPLITASGSTPLGAAVKLALSELEEQKARYRNQGVAYNRPWVFTITDGSPTDNDWRSAASACRAAELAGKLTFFGIGVGAADLATLAEFSARSPQKLQGLKFRELFLWLSRSTSTASKASQNTSVQLPPPADWLQVST